MFARKTCIIEPISLQENVLVYQSVPAEISKKTTVSVPTQFKAYAFIDQKLAFRIDPCIQKNIVKCYGKEYIGNQLKVAFVISRTLAQSPWGFGNIQVNNERLHEAYRIGANGKFTIEIVDYVKLIQCFPNNDMITVEQIREKTISTLKTVGTPILGKYFSDTNTSVFEMSSLISDFRDRFIEALQSEQIFETIGIRVSALTVDGFHVNEDDLELIRNRINA